MFLNAEGRREKLPGGFPSKQTSVVLPNFISNVFSTSAY
ncbi:hypothetical protein Nos7107_1788 [Nostoc sp. PCC 7107]|nr:hypothetical protein Nos7107_1788 [Nostoc sp. PCC 7107]